MKNIVIFRLQDDETLWVADLEAGTVEPTDAASIDATAPQSSGIDFAVARTARVEAASHHMYRGPRLDGIEFAVAASERSASASHHMFPNR